MTHGFIPAWAALSFAEFVPAQAAIGVAGKGSGHDAPCKAIDLKVYGIEVGFSRLATNLEIL